MTNLKGEIWLSDGNSKHLALEQFGLLAAIQESGSISAAAKAVGISYKTAWARIERLNNLSQLPLVARSTGGSKGGGTSLTSYGVEMLAGFSLLKEQHEDFLKSIGNQLKSIDDISGFVKHTKLQANARNQFVGTVSTVECGEVNAELLINLSVTLSLVAQVNQKSQDEMQFIAGSSVLALIKASSITLAAGTTEGLKISARNQFPGIVARIDKGLLNSDISMDLGDSKTLSAIITNQSVSALGLKEGSSVTAFFKASSVILVQA